MTSRTRSERGNHLHPNHPFVPLPFKLRVLAVQIEQGLIFAAAGREAEHLHVLNVRFRGVAGGGEGVAVWGDEDVMVHGVETDY